MVGRSLGMGRGSGSYWSNGVSPYSQASETAKTPIILVEEYKVRNGMGQGDIFLQPIVERVVRAIEPAALEMVRKVTEAAEPTIRTVIREEIMPKVGLYTVIGLVGVGAVAALIGSYMATRR